MIPFHVFVITDDLIIVEIIHNLKRRNKSAFLHVKTAEYLINAAKGHGELQKFKTNIPAQANEVFEEDLDKIEQGEE